MSRRSIISWWDFKTLLPILRVRNSSYSQTTKRLDGCLQSQNHQADFCAGDCAWWSSTFKYSRRHSIPTYKPTICRDLKRPHRKSWTTNKNFRHSPFRKKIKTPRNPFSYQGTNTITLRPIPQRSTFSIPQPLEWIFSRCRERHITRSDKVCPVILINTN